MSAVADLDSSEFLQHRLEILEHVVLQVLDADGGNVGGTSLPSFQSLWTGLSRTIQVSMQNRKHGVRLDISKYTPVTGPSVKVSNPPQSNQLLDDQFTVRQG